MAGNLVVDDEYVRQSASDIKTALLKLDRVVEQYLEILKAAPIPNVAIGGLTPENCGRPLELGASGLAVAGGILGADSITEAVRRFRERLRENGNRK